MHGLQRCLRHPPRCLRIAVVAGLVVGALAAVCEHLLVLQRSQPVPRLPAARRLRLQRESGARGSGERSES